MQSTAFMGPLAEQIPINFHIGTTQIDNTVVEFTVWGSKTGDQMYIHFNVKGPSQVRAYIPDVKTSRQRTCIPAS